MEEWFIPNVMSFGARRPSQADVTIARGVRTDNEGCGDVLCHECYSLYRYNDPHAQKLGVSLAFEKRGKAEADTISTELYAPQSVAPDTVCTELEEQYKNLKATGVSYSGSSVYTLDDQHYYVRIVATPRDNNQRFSNGQQVKPGKPYWFEVTNVQATRGITIPGIPRYMDYERTKTVYYTPCLLACEISTNLEAVAEELIKSSQKFCEMKEKSARRGDVTHKQPVKKAARPRGASNTREQRS